MGWQVVLIHCHIDTLFVPEDAQVQVTDTQILRVAPPSVEADEEETS
jgi:hypothetical protein